MSERETSVTSTGQEKPILWMHKGCGQWCKKIEGKLYYFGKDYSTAVERFRSMTALEPGEPIWNRGVKHYFNQRLTQICEEAIFDDVYPIYWEAKEHMETCKAETAEESIRIWKEQMEGRLNKWDFSRRVYVITDGEFIKIGSAKYVFARLDNLQVGSPRQLNLMLNLPGGARHERELHEWFGADKVRRKGEWFNPSIELTNYIASVQMLATSTKDPITYAAKATFKKPRYVAGVGHTTPVQNAGKSETSNSADQQEP